MLATGIGWRCSSPGASTAGKNLGEVLRNRAQGLPAAVQMCDALSRNPPKALGEGVNILLANCLTHGRRQFVEVAGAFPDECRFVLETLGSVYVNDAFARSEGMTTSERLMFHQARSGLLMEGLMKWFDLQLAERQAEPNSGLGKAIQYLQRHWKALTVFLREAGGSAGQQCVRASFEAGGLSGICRIGHPVLRESGRQLR